VTVGDIT